MEKINVAIIGQGRSGRNIHGKYFLSPNNTTANVVAIVDEIPQRREKAVAAFGCDVYADYRELFNRKDIDLIVNASYSQMHYAISKDCLLHGFNVLSEKPFGASWLECQDLIHTAKKRNLVIAAFHQSLLAPNFVKVANVIKSGILGKITQVDLNYNGFARRWDWQTLQHRCAGGVYNSGPHPIGQALSLLGWDPNTTVAFSRLDTVLTSGDADDYAKIILTAPGKPVMDIEINSADGANPYTFKVCGSKGVLVVKGNNYELKYIKPEELCERPVIREALADENGDPIYCGNDPLNWTTEEGSVVGDGFTSAVHEFYEMMRAHIKEGKELTITPQMAAEVIRVIETCHATNPLPVKFGLED